YMAESARERENLDWETWAGRLQEYFSLVEFLFSPTLIIVGGGVSKHHRKFLPLLDLHTPIVPAELRNEAGIVGAAALARRAEEENAALRQRPRAARRWCTTRPVAWKRRRRPAGPRRRRPPCASDRAPPPGPSRRCPPVGAHPRRRTPPPRRTPPRRRRKRRRAARSARRPR